MERVMVFSAHALDFLWREGGMIARYVKEGCPVKVICASYGARGESNDIWKKNPGITEEEVAMMRKKDAETAAGILRAELVCLGWNDHPLEMTKERIIQMTRLIMEFQPTIVATHVLDFPLAPDHPAFSNGVITAIRYATVNGVCPDLKPCGWIKIYLDETSQPEFTGFKPDVYLDVTDVMDVKRAAMEAVCASQPAHVKMYMDRAVYRATIAGKITKDNRIQYAEAFMRYNPYVGKLL